jgi:hypothetical protein
MDVSPFCPTCTKLRCACPYAAAMPAFDEPGSTLEALGNMHEPHSLPAMPIVGLAVESDVVNHPPHYQAGGLEVIDVIEGFALGFRLGNAVKYILRAGKKGDRLEDLKKAAWYLAREIDKGGV